MHNHRRNQSIVTLTAVVTSLTFGCNEQGLHPLDQQDGNLGSHRIKDDGYLFGAADPMEDLYLCAALATMPDEELCDNFEEMLPENPGNLTYIDCDSQYQQIKDLADDMLDYFEDRPDDLQPAFVNSSGDQYNSSKLIFNSGEVTLICSAYENTGQNSYWNVNTTFYATDGSSVGTTISNGNPDKLLFSSSISTQPDSNPATGYDGLVEFGYEATSFAMDDIENLLIRY